MLRATFQHIAGIGKETELRLWRSGIYDWADIRATRLASRPQVRVAIQASEEALSKKDSDYFFSHLPAEERWRVISDFGARFAAVDIETTGLSIYDKVTVIGVDTQGEYRAFIEGSNLEDAVEALESAGGLLTFNGTLFDLPFLRRTFPGIRLPSTHLDLRFLGRRVGFKGSLKEVERVAGLHRPREIEDLGGYAATVLWSRFGHGDINALELLVKYNSADTCGLWDLCEIIVGRLREGLVHRIRQSPQELRLFEAQSEDLPFRPRGPLPRTARPKIEVEPGSLAINGSAVPVRERKWGGAAIRIDAVLGQMGNARSRVIGIDLSGSEARASGWALVEGDLVVTRTVKTTEDIVRLTTACKPRLVSIDSPLSIPQGRDCTSDDCECRRYGISRSCERELRRRGISVYWCLIRSMQSLTRRGMQIAEQLRRCGIEVIESYPGAAQDIMGIPRKRASREQLRASLASFGLKGIPTKEIATHDELDAITSAVVGLFYLAGLYEPLGSESEGYLILPVVQDKTCRTEVPVFSKIATHRSLLVFLAGSAAHGAAEQVSRELRARLVASPAEAGGLLDGSGTGLMLYDDPSWYEDVLASLGPRVRCILVETKSVRQVRKNLPFCELALDIEAPDWRSDLQCWLARFEAKEDR